MTVVKQYITIEVTARPELQDHIERGDKPLETVLSEIVNSLDEIGVDAVVVDIGDRPPSAQAT